MRAFFEDKNVLAFFTDRKGGYSKIPYDSLNVSFGVGDDIRDVIKNRQIIADKEDFLLENLVFMKQVHGSDIKVIQNSFINEIQDTDGLVTNKKKIPLMVVSADCAGILMYDKKEKIVGALHSGREGTFQNIAKKAIVKFEELGSKKENICIHISPSIGVCCYEIGKEMGLDVMKKFGKKYIKIRDKKYFLDLKNLIKDRLLQEGIKEKNVNISDICTSCDRSYFSYRRDGQTGRFCSVIMLK